MNTQLTTSSKTQFVQIVAACVINNNTGKEPMCRHGAFSYAGPLQVRISQYQEGAPRILIRRSD